MSIVYTVIHVWHLIKTVKQDTGLNFQVLNQPNVTVRASLWNFILRSVIMKDIQVAQLDHKRL